MTTILLTGATDGIGLATARALARRGARVLVHGRNPAKVARVADELDTEGLLGDLSSMDEVRRLAESAREIGPIDVLLHNAGVFTARYALTDDGFELTLAVNHLAPFLLTHLLLDSIVDGGRIVTVSSIAHTRGRIHWTDLELRAHFTPYGAYAQSKLANVLFANALARRVAARGITSNSLHPGVIDTKLLRAGFAIQGATVESGAETSVHLALSPDVEGVTGAYFDDCKEREPSPSARSEEAQERLWFRSSRLLGLLGAVLFAVGCPLGLEPDDDDTGAVDDDDAGRLCNGLTVLCGRSFAEVVLPATHNSMSNAADLWVAPNQNVGIEQQLDDGIRGLLLDTHDFFGEPHLCHNNCLLGRRPLIDALEGIDAFLRAHPNEVLAVIFQDGISPEVTAGAFEASGLIDHVYRHDGGDWPTLGAMIDAGTRLVVTAESEGPPPAWYHHAWSLFSDSPYSFGDIDAFSCELNRGEEANGLFLLNHWIGNPLPNEAASIEANAGAVLRARVADCEAVRGRLPSMLAVDHYDAGDLFEVVRGLNQR